MRKMKSGVSWVREGPLANYFRSCFHGRLPAEEGRSLFGVFYALFILNSTISMQMHTTFVFFPLSKYI